MFSKKTITQIRRWNAAIHRDFGYFFFGMTIIYAVSGIALNHLKDWDPNYVQQITAIALEEPVSIENMDKDAILAILDPHGEADQYNKHFFPDNKTLKVYLKGGTMVLDLPSGKGEIERLKKRWLFNQFNFLHYNAPKRLWTFFADVYSISLIVLAITGLFILKGKKGIKGRGAWLTLAGIIIPVLLFYYYA